jgi:serine/threonine-protein kinase HipA
MKRCLFCYQSLLQGEIDFHPKCSKKIFGQPLAPEVPFSESDAEHLALEIIRTQMTVTGVQPKLSLELDRKPSAARPARFTIVGLWGSFILKPPTLLYSQLPEVEDLTMRLAEIAKIKTVPHSLIRLQSGNLAYITKRIDRTPKGKLHLEDMCQLTDKLTEHKYRGSYEQIAKTIRLHSEIATFDLVSFWEQVLFSFLTGNADMHLKNFSLLNAPNIGYCLAPAYDMVATVLVNPADDEDLALTLNGKKKKINREDFIAAFTASRLDAKQQQNIFSKMQKAIPKWLDFIDLSFLSEDFKGQYKALILERKIRLAL